MRADKEKMHSMKKADVSPKDRSALLADTLRRYRLAAGFSQQSVAAAIGISRSAYTYYETGKTSPDPTTLNRIAKIFDVPLEVFFQEEGHTDGARFRDPGVKPRRAPKKIKEDPQKVGGLTGEEKTLVAYLRSRGISGADALEVLKKFYDYMVDPDTYFS